MALQIMIAVLVVVALLGLFIGTRPARFRIARSAEIGAPGPVVFSLVNDFHQWGKWSPWEKFDPNMKKTFEGSDAGTGARYAWSGNNKAGEGSMTILDSKPGELVSIRLEFVKPFTATNQTTFKFGSTGNGTRVEWIMEGENGFMAKAFALLMNMDKTLSKQFDEGLANLNSAAQAGNTPAG